MNTQQRRYRQSDALYDLIGALADTIGTNRTTVVEMGVHALREDAARRPKYYRGLAKAIDKGRRRMGPLAAIRARLRESEEE